MDFTINTYKQLLKALQQQDFPFQTFQEYLERPTQPPPDSYRDPEGVGLPLGNKRAREAKNKIIILRHDVDKLPENSLRFAQIQHELGIKGSYYFRMVPESFDTDIIKQIANLGHEIGYHYEDIDLVNKTRNTKRETQNPKHETRNKLFDEKLLADEAILLFEKHLAELRKYYPVKTICMHGSPLSKYDNKLIWKYYNYRNYGIIGEPYFDVDFSNVLYLTDTGRRWDGEAVSVRDKVNKDRADTPLNYKRENSDNFLLSPQPPEGGSPLGDQGARIGQSKKFHSSSDIIRASEKGELPYQIMFTFHPQRWTDKPFPWVKELVLQNVKNLMKYGLNRLK
ncbi:MAG: hypothetical protein RBT49_00385 [Bacteroidales bacterium]|jgi:hypothetical protein|nr:hypothetical protein [Bacteroidales bacterium]